MAHVVIDLGEVRHDIRCGAAARDHVVHARIRWNVLAHQVRHVVHGLDAVECGAALLGRARGMSREAVEAELGRLVGKGLVDAREIHVRGVPVHHCVDVVEEAGAHHVHLSGAAFFRGGAVHADRARRAALLEPVGERDAGGDRCSAEEVMPAGVAGVLAFDRLAIGHGVLVDAGERVELGEDADHGLAAARGRDERRRNAGDAGFDLESGFPSAPPAAARSSLFPGSRPRRIPRSSGRSRHPGPRASRETGACRRPIRPHRRRRRAARGRCKRRQLSCRISV